MLAHMRWNACLNCGFRRMSRWCLTANDLKAREKSSIRSFSSISFDSFHCWDMHVYWPVDAFFLSKATMPGPRRIFTNPCSNKDRVVCTVQPSSTTHYFAIWIILRTYLACIIGLFQISQTFVAAHKVWGESINHMVSLWKMYTPIMCKLHICGSTYRSTRTKLGRMTPTNNWCTISYAVHKRQLRLRCIYVTGYHQLLP